MENSITIIPQMIDFSTYCYECMSHFPERGGSSRGSCCQIQSPGMDESTGDVWCLCNVCFIYKYIRSTWQWRKRSNSYKHKILREPLIQPPRLLPPFHSSSSLCWEPRPLALCLIYSVLSQKMAHSFTHKHFLLPPLS